MCNSLLAQWKLVRSAIEHENTLVSHRVTWFLATQLFLFAGFSSIFVKAVEKDLLFGSAKVYSAFVVISCIGIWICILAWANMRAAGKMMGRLRDWWIMNYHPKDEDFEAWRQSVQFFGITKSFPPINGVFTDNLLEYFGEKRLPAAIAMCWLLLLVLTTLFFIQRRPQLVNSFVFGMVTTIAIEIVLVLFFKRKTVEQWLKSDNTRLRQELIELHDKIHGKS
jgi:hypothetical protein